MTDHITLSRSVVENFEITGPDDDNLLWLVLRGKGATGKAMFNMGLAHSLSGRAALLFEQDRRAALAVLLANPGPVLELVLSNLDELKDDAAAHIYPSDLRKCMTSECVVEVASVRVGNPKEKSVPLFSREQVEEALRATLAGAAQAEPVAVPEEFILLADYLRKIRSNPQRAAALERAKEKLDASISQAEQRREPWHSCEKAPNCSCFDKQGSQLANCWFAPATAPQPAQPVAVPQGWVMPTEAEIDEYIEDYEMRGDGSDYRPTEQERFVIKDAIMGLLAESFKGHATTPPAATVPVLEPLTDAEIQDVIDESHKTFRAWSRGIRGQMFMPQDDVKWHLIRAVEAAHNAKLAKRGGA